MPSELKEELPPGTDGVQSIWLVEEGVDKAARQNMAKVLKGADIEFRKLRRILKTMFDKSVQESYTKKEITQFDLGYRAALNEVYKLIPTTRSE